MYSDSQAITATTTNLPHAKRRPTALERRATLRDLYTSGLVSIFRRDSIFQLLEPRRPAPRYNPFDRPAA